MNRIRDGNNNIVEATLIALT
jgi:hypothetical protein